MESHKNRFSGVVVPMITPISDDGTVDEQAVVKIINRFVTAGVYPFILGTTGEGTSLSQKEKYNK